MSKYFDYNDIKIEGKKRLSPSGISKLFDNPAKWYDETIKGNKSFFGNTNTVIGTIIHGRIHKYYDGIEPVDIDDEFQYVDSYKDVAEVNAWTVADEVDRLWDLVRLAYLEKYPKPDKVEGAIKFEIPNSKYYIGGSFDALEGNTVIDFKTTSTTPKKINVSHRLQLLMYSLILNLKGIKTNKMRVVYIVKLKKEPKVVILEEDISKQDLDYIKTQIKNIVKRLELVDEDETLRELLFAPNPLSRL